MSALSLKRPDLERGKSPLLPWKEESASRERSIPQEWLKPESSVKLVYTLVEVVEQLRHDANGSQIENAQVGMAQNIGGRLKHHNAYPQTR